jgi:hypothetical protein
MLAEPPFFALLPAVRRPVRGMQNWTFGSPSCGTSRYVDGAWSGGSA